MISQMTGECSEKEMVIVNQSFILQILYLLSAY